MSLHKILLVEDEPALATAFLRILKHSNYEVTHAENGLEALALVEQNMPDMVLCDINMPIMDGREFCVAFRKLPNSRNVPFVFLTSNGAPEDVRNGMNLGADDYLKKPCGRKELIDTVETRLQRKAEIENSVRELINKYSLEIDKRDKCLGAIAQNQSHVIRAPLAALMGVVSVLDMEEMGETNVKLVQTIYELTKELDKVIRGNVYSINYLSEEKG